MTRRTAGYAVTIHPDQIEALEAQLERLPADNPVRVALGIVLGLDLLVDLPVCGTCGAVVHDDLLHGTWHDQLDARTG
ncbi:hypothetical protein A5721_23900 [Mycobacterium vulneris]|nr:hypothetical protein A5721_23900 [Mycolicibacterium vulneris]